MLSVDVALLLGVIVMLRLRRRTESRSRNDEKMTVLIVLVLGVLIAPTPFGQWMLDVLGRLVHGVAEISFRIRPPRPGLLGRRSAASAAVHESLEEGAGVLAGGGDGGRGADGRDGGAHGFHQVHPGFGSWVPGPAYRSPCSPARIAQPDGVRLPHFRTHENLCWPG